LVVIETPGALVSVVFLVTVLVVVIVVFPVEVAVVKEFWSFLPMLPLASVLTAE